MGQTTFSNSKSVPMRFQAAISGKNTPSANSVPISNRNPFANMDAVAADGYVKSKKPQFGAAFPTNAELGFLDDIGGNITRWFSGVTGSGDGFSLSSDAVKKSVLDAGGGNIPATALLWVAGGLAVLASGVLGHKVGSSQIKPGQVITKIEEKIRHSGGGAGTTTRIVHTPIPSFSFAGKSGAEITAHLDSLSSPQEVINTILNPNRTSNNNALHELLLDDTNLTGAAEAAEAVLKKLRGNSRLLQRLLFEQGDGGLKPIDLAASKPNHIETLRSILTELRSTTTTTDARTGISTTRSNHFYNVLRNALVGTLHRTTGLLNSKSTLHYSANNPEGIRAIFGAVPSTDPHTIPNLLSAERSASTPTETIAETPAHLAIKANDIDSFNAILDKHVELGLLPRLITTYENSSGETLFHSAAQSPNPAFIRALMDLVKDHPIEFGTLETRLLARDAKGNRVSHHAAQHSPDALEEILTEAATHTAAPMHSDTGVVRLDERILTLYGAGNKTILNTSAEHNVTAFTNLITRYESDPIFMHAITNWFDAENMSPYFRAIKHQPEALRALLDRPAIKTDIARLKAPISAVSGGPITTPAVIPRMFTPDATTGNHALHIAVQNHQSLALLKNALQEALDTGLPNGFGRDDLRHLFKLTNDSGETVFHGAADQNTSDSLEHILSLVQPTGRLTISLTLLDLMTAVDGQGRNALQRAVAKSEASTRKILESAALPPHPSERIPDRNLRSEVLTHVDDSGRNVIHRAKDEPTIDLLFATARELEPGVPLPQITRDFLAQKTINEVVRGGPSIGQRTPLQMALADNKLAIVPAILKEAEKDPVGVLQPLLEAVDQGGRNALHVIKDTDEDVDTVKRLFEAANRIDTAGPLSPTAQRLITQKNNAKNGRSGFQEALIDKPAVARVIFEEAKKHPATLEHLLDETDGWAQNNVLRLSNKNAGMTKLLLDEIQPESETALTPRMRNLITQQTVNHADNSDTADQTILHGASAEVIALILDRIKRVDATEFRNLLLTTNAEQRDVLHEAVTRDLDAFNSILDAVEDNPALLRDVLTRANNGQYPLDLAMQHNIESTNAILRRMEGKPDLLRHLLDPDRQGNNFLHLGTATGVPTPGATSAIIKVAKTDPATPSTAFRLMNAANWTGNTGLVEAAGNPALFREMLEAFAPDELNAGNLETHDLTKLIAAMPTLPTPPTAGAVPTPPPIEPVLQKVPLDSAKVILERLQNLLPAEIETAKNALLPRVPAVTDLSNDSNSGAVRAYLDTLDISAGHANNISNDDKDKLTNFFEYGWLLNQLPIPAV